MVSSSLHLDQFGHSVMVSICCKRSSSDEGSGLHLALGVRIGAQLEIVLVLESGSSMFSVFHGLTSHGCWARVTCQA